MKYSLLLATVAAVQPAVYAQPAPSPQTEREPTPDNPSVMELVDWAKRNSAAITCGVEKGRGGEVSQTGATHLECSFEEKHGLSAPIADIASFCHDEADCQACRALFTNRGSKRSILSKRILGALPDYSCGFRPKGANSAGQAKPSDPNRSAPPSYPEEQRRPVGSDAGDDADRFAFANRPNGSKAPEQQRPAVGLGPGDDDDDDDPGQSCSDADGVVNRRARFNA